MRISERPASGCCMATAKLFVHCTLIVLATRIEIINNFAPKPVHKAHWHSHSTKHTHTHTTTILCSSANIPLAKAVHASLCLISLQVTQNEFPSCACTDDSGALVVAHMAGACTGACIDLNCISARVCVHFYHIFRPLTILLYCRNAVARRRGEPSTFPFYRETTAATISR